MPILHTGQFFGQGGGGPPVGSSNRQAAVTARGSRGDGVVYVNTGNTAREAMAASTQVNEA